ncbi:MAG: DNA polymerase III subunit [Dethiobacteria bacterium]|jgi:DNA polymerase-3 subunit delta'|nr:DNA polymerase III subunit [Bacillota bacterium]HOB29595.1 DNA polymerase III subunit [Bacillota bacterium]HPZ40900.1 DNA polymerase III subunit [Bacillota bacterium]HQD51990.1 DNA polymerase III subunit [Bacillota bacterium]
MSFQALSGQAGLRRALTGKLAAGTVSHALLFCGPPGSGKKSWGLALARVLLCSGPEKAEPCGRCRSCRQFQSGQHPALFHLQPQGHRLGIDQIRRIRSKFYLGDGNRVCLIEEAEQMTPEACASLLKILEEPPSGLYFILLTGRPQRLPGTIVSRCQRFTLQPLSNAEIMELLSRQKGLSPGKALLVSRLSKGLPGLALRLSEDSSFEEQLTEAAEIVFNLAGGAQSSREILSLAEELVDREDLLFFLELIYLVCRDGLLYLLCGNESLLIDPVQARRWEGVASPFELEEAMALLQKAVQELSTTNVNRRLTLEGTLLQLQRRFALCPR